MAPYPGLPVPRFTAIAGHDASRPRYHGKAEFYLGKFELPGNCGTYLDSPFHRHRDKEDLSGIELDRVADLEGVLLDAVPALGRAVSADITGLDLAGRAVLLRTGWDARWGTAGYWEPGPFIAAELLDALVLARPALVGVDFWNVDDTGDLSRPAHTKLLAAGILIVEHMANLGALPHTGFRFSAVPLRIVGGASFPVRAFARLDS